jgi:cytochrome c biogenesis protein CcdA
MKNFYFGKHFYFGLLSFVLVFMTIISAVLWMGAVLFDNIELMLPAIIFTLLTILGILIQRVLFKKITK